MRLIATTAPAAISRSAAGIGRSMARAVAVGEQTAGALRALALDIACREGPAGKVHSAGTWECSTTHTQLARALGPPFGTALRSGFEWYYCRGAFFHNDAHYDARLFGVWCIAAAPPMQLVFPRLDLQVAVAPGSIVVFDPFEVHGVLAIGRTAYAASHYERSNASVFVGFELDITPAIAELFDIHSRIEQGVVISSQTRIDAVDGKIDFD